jgi:hypothetical protein
MPRTMIIIIVTQFSIAIEIVCCKKWLVIICIMFLGSTSFGGRVFARECGFYEEEILTNEWWDV